MITINNTPKRTLKYIFELPLARFPGSFTDIYFMRTSMAIPFRRYAPNGINNFFVFSHYILSVHWVFYTLWIIADTNNPWKLNRCMFYASWQIFCSNSNFEKRNKPDKFIKSSSRVTVDNCMIKSHFFCSYIIARQYFAQLRQDNIQWNRVLYNQNWFSTTIGCCWNLKSYM